MYKLNRYPEGSDLLMQLIVQRNGEFYPIVCVHPSFLHFVSIDLLSLFQKLTVSPFCLCMWLGFINCLFIMRILLLLSTAWVSVPYRTAAVAFSLQLGECKCWSLVIL